MKKIFLIIAAYFLLPSFGGVGGGCQPASDLKRDFSWNMGYDGYTQNALQNGYGLTSIDFNTTVPTITARADSAGFRYTSSSICDSMGRLQFYTNGIFIYGADGHTLAGNDTLNLGAWARTFALWGYPFGQMALILPLPNSANKYYVFHSRMNDDSAYPTCVELLYTVVDMAENNGNGRVVTLRNSIIQDSLARGKITACRHANGRDWWVTCWNYDLNKYRKILLNPNGVSDYGWYNTILPAYLTSGIGQSAYSPDGTKYVNITNQVNPLNPTFSSAHVEVFDFNRCTGEFSVSTTFTIEDTTTIQSAHLSISPNSRYLYISFWRPLDGGGVFQYDLEAGNIAASRQIIGTYDGFIDPDFYPYGSTTFLIHQLGFDGKIYICTGNGTKYLHTINNPNIGGVGCNLQQHSVHLPTFNCFAIDDHPHYRLGALFGSSCDTLSTSTSPSPSRGGDYLHLFPNPANEKVRLAWDLLMPDATVCTVANDIGRIVYRDPIAEYSMAKDIDTSRFPNGTYTVTLQNKVLGVFSTIKLVVIH